MSRSIRIDESKWNAQKSALRSMLEGRLRNARAVLSDELRETGAFVAEELGKRTFPSDSAIGLAVAAMRFDLHQVYATSGKVYEILDSTVGKRTANAFYVSWKRGDLSAARQIVRNSGSPISQIVIGEPLRAELRESVRNQKGRVSTAYPLQLVSKGEIDAHAKIAIAEIGKTASGWFACAERLGGDGNAVSWKGTARHGSGGGSVSFSESDTGVHLVLSNEMPLAKKHISPGQVAAILEQGKEFLKRRLQSRKVA